MVSDQGKESIQNSGSGFSRDFLAGKKSRLKPLPLFFCILLLIPTLINADYQTGLNAYANGDYKLAMQEWQAVVKQPPTAVNPAIYVETHYAIARLYWQGQGVPRDYYKAYDWLLKAAKLGHAGAMAKLGYLYTDGITVQQDFHQAFEWYSKAARLGDVDGLYNLGIFYLNGWGTEQDTTMAKQYLAAASAQGDEAAEQALQQLLAMDEPVGAASAATEATGPAEKPGSSVGAASAATASQEDQSRLKPLPQEEVEPEGANLARDRETTEEDVRATSAATEATEPAEKSGSSVGAALAATASQENQSRLKPLPQEEVEPEGASLARDRETTEEDVRATSAATEATETCREVRFVSGSGFSRDSLPRRPIAAKAAPTRARLVATK